MEVLAFIGSAIFFVLFAMIVLLVLIGMSSRLALMILLLMPLVAVLLLPDTSIAFLSFRHMLLADGLVPVNNFHILLIIWSTLIGIILYTEFLTWYLAKGRRMQKSSSVNAESNAFGDIQKNASFAVERVKNILTGRN